MQVAVAALSDVGRRREGNEDAFGAGAPADPATAARRGHLFVVADGMGGASAGEVASRTAVEAVVASHLEREFTDPRAGLTHALVRANAAIFGKAAASPELKGMGTTCTVLLLRDGQAFLAHVGDTRAYLLRNRQLTVLTRDHSLRERGPAFAHILTRAVGIGACLEVDVVDTPLDVEDDDVFLLCSDGLWAELDEAVLGSTMNAERDLDGLCRRLIGAACESGGTDNITAQIVRVTDPERRRRWPRLLRRFVRRRSDARLSWSTRLVGDAADG